MKAPVQYLNVARESDHVMALAKMSERTGLVVLSCRYRSPGGLLIEGASIYQDGHLVKGGLMTPDAVAAAVAELP